MSYDVFFLNLKASLKYLVKRQCRILGNIHFMPPSYDDFFSSSPRDLHHHHASCLYSLLTRLHLLPLFIVRLHHLHHHHNQHSILSRTTKMEVILSGFEEEDGPQGRPGIRILRATLLAFQNALATVCHTVYSPSSL